MANKVDCYTASDYAGASYGHHKFYYGYERTMCQHGNDSHCDCDRDWCFIAEYCGREVMRFSATQMKIDRDNVTDGLIKGMLVYIGKYANRI